MRDEVALASSRPLPSTPVPEGTGGLSLVDFNVCLSFLFLRGTVRGYHEPLVLVSDAQISPASEPVVDLGAPVSPNLFQVFHRYEVQLFQQVV